MILDLAWEFWSGYLSSIRSYSSELAYRCIFKMGANDPPAQAPEKHHDFTCCNHRFDETYYLNLQRVLNVIPPRTPRYSEC